MPLCYIFAKSLPSDDNGVPESDAALGNSQAGIALESGAPIAAAMPVPAQGVAPDASNKVKTVDELVQAFIKSAQDPKAEIPTWQHVCAALDGDYQFLLKFRYEFLEDVALAVLKNRKAFDDHISQTLTMLQYPDGVWTPEPTEPRERLGDLRTTGIVLVQETLLEQAEMTSADILNNLKKLNPSVTCIDVFGPYDYLVEFPLVTSSDLDTMKDAIGRFYGKRIARTLPLISTPYQPTSL